MLIIFRIGMVYNAYKIKRYGWMLSALILGDIFSIIFYFTILKKYATGLNIDKKIVFNETPSQTIKTKTSLIL